VNDPHAPDTPPETPPALPDAPADAPVAPASTSDPGGDARVLIPPVTAPPVRPVGDQIYEIGDVAFGAKWRAHLVVPPGVAPTDLLAAARFLPTSGWRTFRIEARGANLTFKLDSETLLTTTDATFPAGQFGIGYQEIFTTNTNIVGTRADHFFADSIPGSESDRWELE
jgi:hypothetical protein